MKKLMVLAFAGLVLASGCTQGRVRFLHLDFRKPEQIRAGVAEAEAPFKDWKVCSTNAPAAAPAPVAQAQGLPLEWYTALFDMIAKLEADLCLFEMEWKDEGVEKAKK